MKKILVLFSLLLLFVATVYAAEPPKEPEEFTWANWLYFWRLHIESIILVGVSAWEYFTFRKEAERRNKKLEFRILVLGAMTIFLNCIFIAHKISVLFPLACGILLVYPFYYRDLGVKKMKKWLWIGIALMTLVIMTDPTRSMGISGRIFLPIIYGLIFYFKGKSMLKDVCPHCNYYANHPMINEEVLEQHTKTESTVYKTKDKTTKETSGNTTVITDHYTEHKSESTYLIKRIRQTFECDTCHQQFSRQIITSDLIGGRQIY